MTVTQDDAAERAAYWPLPIVRAVPAAGLAIVIAFTAEHSPRFGLLAFAGFGIVSGIIVAASSAVRLRGRRSRPFFVAQGIVSLVLGVFALLISFDSAGSGGVGFLFLILTAFAAITGLLELYSGFVSRGSLVAYRFVASKDWMIVGAITVVTALVFLVVPPGYSQRFKDPDGVTRVLDASVIVVGILGVYGGLIAVFLVIAGLSAKWGTDAAATSSPSTITESEQTA